MNANLNAYKEYLINNYAAWSNRAMSSYPERAEERLNEFRNSIRFEEGNKFIKVIVGSSVHSFIVKNDDAKFKSGDILKAASWKAPAKNFSRGNVLNNVYGSIMWAGA